MDTLFFYSSKLIWGLLQPESLVVGLMLLATGCAVLGWHVATRRMVIATTTCLIALAVIPVGELVIRPLEEQYKPRLNTSQVEGIVVLGGGEDLKRSEFWNQPQIDAEGDRFIIALALAKRYPAAKVLFTGGRASLNPGKWTSNSVVADMLVDAGLDRRRLINETSSRTTAENARLSLEAMGGEQSGPWILVTSAFHMPRAVATFCEAGWRQLVPWPTDYRSQSLWDGIGWDLAGNLETLTLALKEWVGLVGYRLTGRLTYPLSNDCLAANEP